MKPRRSKNQMVMEAMNRSATQAGERAPSIYALLRKRGLSVKSAQATRDGLFPARKVAKAAERTKAQMAEHRASISATKFQADGSQTARQSRRRGYMLRRGLFTR